MKVQNLKKVNQVHPQANRNHHHLVQSVSSKINSYYAINVSSLASSLDKVNMEKEKLPISYQEIHQLMTILQIKKIIGVQIQIYKELQNMISEQCQAMSLIYLSIFYCIDSGTRYQNKLKKKYYMLSYIKVYLKKNRLI